MTKITEALEALDWLLELSERKLDDTEDWRYNKVVAALTASQEQQHLIEQLKDPLVVHVSMLRGDIACPSPEAIEHIYQGKLPSVAKAQEQQAEIDRLRKALTVASGALSEASDKFHVLSFYIKDTPARECCEAKVGEMFSANKIARQALSPEQGGE